MKDPPAREDFLSIFVKTCSFPLIVPASIYCIDADIIIQCAFAVFALMIVTDQYSSNPTSMFLISLVLTILKPSQP